MNEKRNRVLYERIDRKFSAQKKNIVVVGSLIGKLWFQVHTAVSMVNSSIRTPYRLNTALIVTRSTLSLIFTPCRACVPRFPHVCSTEQ